MQYTAEYIANIFWSQGIAKVKSIVLTPYLYNSSFYQTAYIHIDSWCDSEIAYNFIKRLQDKQKTTRIVHHVDDWWPVKINTMEANTIMKLYQYSGKNLTTFEESYYQKYTNTETETYTNKETNADTDSDSDSISEQLVELAKSLAQRPAVPILIKRW